MTDNKTKETEVEKSIRLDERKNNFKKEVKKRLYTEFKRTRWSYDDLVDELRERDYKVNKGTLKNMVDPINESSFDLWIIKGLCECFNISLGELLEDHMLLASKEKTAESTSENLKNIDTNNKLLQDFSQYKGTYYCYSNSKNYGKNDIVEFKLEIDDTNGITAALTYYGNIDDKREETPFPKTYVCVPKLLGKDRVVMLEFTKGGNSFFHFYFKYTDFYTSHLYHRRGFYVTTSTDNDHEGAALINCFVLFDKQLSLSDAKKYVPSLLSLDNTKFLITEETYNNIMQEKTELSNFLTKYDKYFEKKVGFCIINEAKLLNELKTITQKEVMAHEFSLLTQIKSYADNCTQVIFNDELPYARFTEFVLKNDKKELT